MLTPCTTISRAHSSATGTLKEQSSTTIFPPSMTTVVVVWPAKGSQLMDVCRDIIAMYNGNKVRAIGE